MTLRDEFAKAALTGMMADPSLTLPEHVKGAVAADAYWAMRAYALSDAMLAARAASCDCSRTNINGVTPCSDTLNDNEHASDCRIFAGGASYPITEAKK